MTDKTQQFIDRLIIKQGAEFANNFLLLDDYINALKKINVKCIECGSIVNKRPNSLMNGYGCKRCFYKSARNSAAKSKSVEQFIIGFNNLKLNMVFSFNKDDYTDAHTDMKFICKTCDYKFLRSPAQLLCHKRGCLRCSGHERLTKEQFIEKAQKIHQNRHGNPLYDYSKSEYKSNKTHIIIICKKCKLKDRPCEFNQRPDNHLHNKSGCPLCKAPKKGEPDIERYLVANGVVYERQKRFSNCKNIKNNILPFDFFIPSHNTCIEFDGHRHFISVMGSDLEKQRMHDAIKTKYCNDNNIKLIRITHFENSKEILHKKLNFLKDKK